MLHWLSLIILNGIWVELWIMVLLPMIGEKQIYFSPLEREKLTKLPANDTF